MDNVFDISDIEPSFGTKRQLRNYIKANLKYPKGFHKKRNAGLIVISFVVESTGELSNIEYSSDYSDDMKIKDRISQECKNYALELVQSMQNWKPGEIANQKIRVHHFLKIQFRKGKVKQRNNSSSNHF